MDLLLTLLKGMAIGFAMAVPVGPVGLLCIRRTLNYGLVFGLLSGLGAAFADALFAAVAAGGLASLTDFLLGIERQLQLAGGVFLVVLGIWTYFKHPVEKGSTRRGHHGAIATTFLLTLTNPMTLLAFIGFFVAFGVTTGEGMLLGIAVLVVGVFLGSALWWTVLCVGIGKLRHSIEPGLLHRINCFSALGISCFGVYVLLQPML